MPVPEKRASLRGHIVIVGAMGSGKTTLARGVAEALGREFFDSDKSIRARTGRSGREIALSEGVKTLHRQEREVFFHALATPEPSVVAAAASVIESPEVQQALEAEFCVWVTADPEILARRSAGGNHRRPVSAEETERLERRTPMFEQSADLVIDTGVLSKQDAVARVVAAIEEGEPR